MKQQGVAVFVLLSEKPQYQGSANVCNRSLFNNSNFIVFLDDYTQSFRYFLPLILFKPYTGLTKTIGIPRV